MSNFFYLDRPAVPATQQIAVNLSGIQEHGVQIDALDTNYSAYATEVKNEESDVVGTLLYYPGVGYAELVRDSIDDSIGDVVEDTDVHDALVPFEFAGRTFGADEEVAQLLEEYEERAEEGLVDGVEPDSLLTRLALKVVDLQIRNNNQYGMIVSLQNRVDDMAFDEAQTDREMVDEDGLDAK